MVTVDVVVGVGEAVTVALPVGLGEAVHVGGSVGGSGVAVAGVSSNRVGDGPCEIPPSGGKGLKPALGSKKISTITMTASTVKPSMTIATKS
jgi:hypothetical protein